MRIKRLNLKDVGTNKFFKHSILSNFKQGDNYVINRYL